MHRDGIFVVPLLECDRQAKSFPSPAEIDILLRNFCTDGNST